MAGILPAAPRQRRTIAGLSRQAAIDAAERATGAFWPDVQWTSGKGIDPTPLTPALLALQRFVDKSSHARGGRQDAVAPL
jgi:hypothetical protein